MKVKKLGFPLVFLSMLGFSLASRFEGMAFSYASMAFMLAGMVLIVVSPFLGSDEEAPVAPSAPSAPKPVPSFPPPSGIEVQSAVPPWIYVVGALVSAAGAAAFFTGSDGVNRFNVVSFSLIPGGIIYILGARFFYGDPADRRNILRGAVALVSSLMIIAGIMTIVFVAAGAFDPGQGKP
jgi:hypothetical protein